MTKQTKVRLSLLLLILALTGFTAFPDREAEAACGVPGDCQVCANREDACIAGLNHPECGGDPTCCHSKFSSCWNCCQWL